MGQKSHWEKVYQARKSEEVSWFQKNATTSLQLIGQAGVALDEGIIDIGGGASTLVDGLLARGYSNLSVLDISEKALDVARQRLGTKAEQVRWMVGDITEVELPDSTYSLWHDRAVFHFLTTAESRQCYVRALVHSVRSGGHVIIATFSEDGPDKCSGLPVRRYSVPELEAELGDSFELQHFERESHETPTGALQSFIYCRFKLSK